MAFLWIPPEVQQIRGAVMAGMTLMERELVQDAQIRRACAQERLAIVFLKCGLGVVDTEKILEDLAKTSGYHELAMAPLMFVGHSAGGPQAKDCAIRFANRCFGLVQYRGGIPGGTPSVPAGIPVLMMIGQFDEFGGTMRNDAGRESWEGGRDALAAFRSQNECHLGSVVVEAGAGHFAWSDRNAEYLALFVRKAAQAKIPQAQELSSFVKLHDLEPQNGWLSQLPNRSGVAHGSAPYAEYKGDKSRAAWHFDREMAEATAAYHTVGFDKQDQFIQWMDPHWVDAGARFFFTEIHWLEDGQSFQVHPAYADRVPGQYNGIGPRWPLAGQSVGHSTAPILVRPVSGPIVLAGPNRFRIAQDTLTPAEEGGRATFLAYSEGDAEYRYTERVGMLPRGFSGFKDGRQQTISFAPIGNLKSDSPPVKLTAASDAGLPVEFYVAYGPATVEDGMLKITEIPVRSVFPIAVKVVAWQFGRGIEPKVQTAKPVEQTIRIDKAAPAAGFQPIEHPFLLWTRDEAAAIRWRIETETWARAHYEAMLKEKGNGQTFRNLFRYLVMGDESVVEPEKQYLVSLIGNNPRKFLGDTGGGRHYDQYLSVLRYDALYDRLSETERRGLEDTFRDFIKHHCEEETLKFTRTSWLPNMQWPRPITAHLMAVALRDERLIRQCFLSKGGWKFYFDDYLADGQFYGEEFGKQYSMIGEMFLWCRGVERLGLNELGYGYTGKGGATMRSYGESMVNIGYPRTELPGGLPHYPQITMGDARGSSLDGAPPYVFQKSIVDGFLPGGAGGNRAWISANMNGRDHKNAKVDKMLAPHWFELAHVKWPDAHFDYFLAQMRKPDETIYTPSLFWGCSPIDAKNVAPPPAPGYVARERGFAFLRAEESPAYWESPAPAVAFQLATYYVHYAHDAFSLLGFHAFNRPIYLNRQISNGYGGSCPWTDSGRGHCGVMVDNLQYELNDADPKRDHPHWPNPIGEVPTRYGFDPLVKFVAARAQPMGDTVTLDNRQPLAGQTLSLDLRREDKEVWPGVDMERALFLTREYLFDVFRLTSDRPRQYDWHVQAIGTLVTDPQWTATDELGLDQIYDLTNRAIAHLLSDPVECDRYSLKSVKKLTAGDSPWTAIVRQDCVLNNPAESILGPAWYNRRVGVCVHMLGEPGTTVYAGLSPESRRTPGKEANKGDKSDRPNEVGGTTLVVRRRTPKTVFAAVHEPFENNAPSLASVRRLAQTREGLAVTVEGRAGSGVNDRILYAFWDSHSAPVTLEGENAVFTFTDRVFLRIGQDKVEASGDLRRLRLPVAGQPRLLINGVVCDSTIADGCLIFAK